MRVVLFSIATLLIFVILTINSKQDTDFDGFSSSSSLPFEDSFDNGLTFSKRGVIRAVVGNSAYASNIKPLSKSETDSLKKTHVNDGYYFFRVPFSSKNNDEYLISSLRLCQLIESDFNINVDITLNIYSEPISVHIATPRTVCTEETSKKAIDYIPTLTIGVILHKPLTGPTPNTLPYLKRLEQQKLEEKARKMNQDDRSFIAKYWMYIVPAVLLLMFSSN